MAKSVSIEDIAYKPYPKVSQYHQIGWLPRLNVRREYGSEREMRETRDNLATAIGWDAQYPAIAEIAVEAEAQEILEQRQEVYKTLKEALNLPKYEPVQIPEDGKNVSIEGREYLLAKIAVFEYFYWDKKGNWKKVDATGTTGNRRGSSILDSGTVQLIVARRKAGPDGAKLQPSDFPAGTITTHINVIVPDTANMRFPDVAVRKQAQIRENETKTSGFKKMTDAERLEAVLDLVENHGKSQSDIRNSGYGAVLGLRLYFACVVDVFCRQMAANADAKAERKLWESINFLTRLMSPQFLSDADRQAGKVNPDWLDFGKFQQKSFQGDKDALPMGLMCETEYKFEKENKRRVSQKTPLSELSRPTIEQVQEWIRANMWGDGNRAKPQLKRDVIATLSGSHPNPFVKMAMSAVDKNNTELLDAAKERAEVCNFVFKASKEVHERMQILFSTLRDLDGDTQVTLLSQFNEAAEEALSEAEANETPEVDAESESEEAPTEGETDAEESEDASAGVTAETSDE